MELTPNSLKIVLHLFRPTLFILGIAVILTVVGLSCPISGAALISENTGADESLSKWTTGSSSSALRPPLFRFSRFGPGQLTENAKRERPLDRGNNSRM